MASAPHFVAFSRSAEENPAEAGLVTASDGHQLASAAAPKMGLISSQRFGALRGTARSIRVD